MLYKKNILIIGGTGSLGHSLVDYYHSSNKITIFSRDENKQWSMKRKYPNLSYIVGDMRNRESISVAIKRSNPDIIIIAGALKHVDICEQNTGECIDTNITGVRNVISAVESSNSRNIESVLLISTDKSCSPVNVYGMCKSISERMMVEASVNKLSTYDYNDDIHPISLPTKFLCVRYGNVLNSRGSLIPKFKEIGESKTETEFLITDENMTRFFMTLNDSVKLIDVALNHGEGGETWIPQVSAFKVKDIADYFSQKYNKPVVVIGIRPGEKLHECLVNETESYRTTYQDVDDSKYYVIHPLNKRTDKRYLCNEYTSQNTSDFVQLKKIIDTE